MQINKVNSYNNSASFKAKFIQNNDLSKVVEYAIEHDKFNKLNQARKNIESCYLPYRIRFEFFTMPDGRPFVIFTRFKPKKDVTIPKSREDYIESEPILYVSSKVMNPLKFGYEKIVDMGKCVPKNNIFKRVVVFGREII